jgi:hypothetical protein
MTSPSLPPPAAGTPRRADRIELLLRIAAVIRPWTCAGIRWVRNPSYAGMLLIFRSDRVKPAQLREPGDCPSVSHSGAALSHPRRGDGLDGGLRRGITSSIRRPRGARSPGSTEASSRLSTKRKFRNRDSRRPTALSGIGRRSARVDMTRAQVLDRENSFPVGNHRLSEGRTVAGGLPLKSFSAHCSM